MKLERWIAGMSYWIRLNLAAEGWSKKHLAQEKEALIATGAGYESSNVRPVLTSRLRGLQHDADELGHIEVRGVVHGPHVGPARAQVRICTQGKELAGKAGRRLCITWGTKAGECVSSAA